MSKLDEKVEQAFKQGRLKSNRDHIRHIKSRTIGPDGKLYSGSEGELLLKKKLEEQEYNERNKK